MSTFTRAVFGLMIFVLPVSAFAHTSGIFYETVVDNVHIDIGYSSAAPQVGESVIFDFNLAATQKPIIEYSDVWVRVDDAKGNVVLATAVHNASFGGPRMSYVFPNVGAYTISVRYEKEGDAIAKASFPITVIPATPNGFFERITNAPWYLISGVSALLGAIILFAFTRFGLVPRTVRPSKSR